MRPLLLLLGLGATAPAMAGGETITVYNDTPAAIVGYFKAIGCVGVHGGRTTVCHYQTIPSGGSASYRFPGASSAPKMDASCRKAVDALWATDGSADGFRAVRVVHEPSSPYCDLTSVSWKTGDLHRMQVSGGRIIEGAWIGLSEAPTKMSTGWHGFRAVTGGGHIFDVRDHTHALEPVYAVQAGGDLYYYEGGYSGSTKQGSGWTMFSHVFGGNRGVLYGVKPDGELRWYKHQKKDGSMAGRFQSAKVGNGWHGFIRVFGGNDGYIYGIKPNGDLMAYQHLGHTTGSSEWRRPQKVGSGWHKFTHVFAGFDGRIYAVDANGVLKEYVHRGQSTLTPEWTTHTVGNGFDRYARFWAGRDGKIYAVVK